MMDPNDANRAYDANVREPATPDMTPRDPSKPLTRATRRVLVFLLNRGRLQRQRKVLPGRKVQILNPDPREHYWILVSPKPHCTADLKLFKPGRKGYRLTRESIALLVSKGYLRGISGSDEASEDNVTAKGRDVVARTDWNGNWLEGRRP